MEERSLQRKRQVQNLEINPKDHVKNPSRAVDNICRSLVIVKKVFRAHFFHQLRLTSICVGHLIIQRHIL